MPLKYKLPCAEAVLSLEGISIFYGTDAVLSSILADTLVEGTVVGSTLTFPSAEPLTGGWVLEYAQFDLDTMTFDSFSLSIGGTDMVWTTVSGDLNCPKVENSIPSLGPQTFALDPTQAGTQIMYYDEDNEFDTVDSGPCDSGTNTERRSSGTVSVIYSGPCSC